MAEPWGVYKVTKWPHATAPVTQNAGFALTRIILSIAQSLGLFIIFKRQTFLSLTEVFICLLGM